MTKREAALTLGVSHFPWKIKFMDVGLETSDSVNGTGSWINHSGNAGNISSQWGRDAALSESQKVIFRGPYMVTDLYTEGACLTEFELPEEPAVVQVHLWQCRMEKLLPPSYAFPSNIGMPCLDGARSMPSSADAAYSRSNNLGNICNCTNESGEAQATPECPAATNLENRGDAAVQVRYPFGSSNPPHTGSYVSAAEQMWMYNVNKYEPKFQQAPYVRPAYQPPSSSWDPQGLSNNVPFSQVPAELMNTSFQGNAPPFLPTPMTPLVQLPQAPLQHSDQSFFMPVV